MLLIDNQCLVLHPVQCHDTLSPWCFYTFCSSLCDDIFLELNNPLTTSLPFSNRYQYQKCQYQTIICSTITLKIRRVASLVYRTWPKQTRKLCYRKDDRAMRPIQGCPENFRDSLTTPTATIPNIFHGLLFGSTL